MTVVNRRTFKTIQNDEAVALLKEAAQGSQYQYRIYRSHYGEFDTVVLEVEFDSVAQMETVWAEWAASADNVAWLTRWSATLAPGGTNEVWLLEAQG